MKECSFYNQLWISIVHVDALHEQASRAMPLIFFLTEFHARKKIRLVRLFGISISWWTPVFPQITSLCAKSPCQHLDRTIRVYTKASSTYESKWKKFFVMKSFFRGKMEGFEKEKIEKYDKCTNFFSDL